MPKFTDRAIDSQAHAPNVNERADKFKEKFLTRLQMLKVCVDGNTKMLTISKILKF